MKHFLGFLALIFAGLFFAVFLRNHSKNDTRPVLRVFGPTSFVSQTGPGPWLRQAFEKDCGCTVEFVDSPDSATLFHRLTSEARTGADLVIGIDQFSLESAQALAVSTGFDWKSPDVSRIDFEDQIKPALGKPQFVPYEWGVLAFVLRPSQTSELPRKFDHLLEPQWKGQIVLQDPRLSASGFQFLQWLIQIRGEAGAFDFLSRFNKQVKTFTSGWTMAWGLFTKGQAKTVLSYTTSPLYLLQVEKDLDGVAVEFEEGHPIQFNYMAIPGFCKNCALAESFMQFALSAAGQKIVMEKNFMFPVLKGVKDGTPYANIPPTKTLPMSAAPSLAERERILKKWSSLRKME